MKNYNYTQPPGRAADARALGAIAVPGRSRQRSLGSLGGTVLDTPTLSMPLPAPGAPEPLNGCGCGGGCGDCGDGLGDFTLTAPAAAVAIGAAYLLWKLLK